MICLHCGETVHTKERQFILNGTYHYACAFRLGAGSVAHIEKRCSCYVPGSNEGDPPGMTLRQAAQAALDAWVRINVFTDETRYGCHYDEAPHPKRTRRSH